MRGSFALGGEGQTLAKATQEEGWSPITLMEGDDGGGGGGDYDGDNGDDGGDEDSGG